VRGAVWTDCQAGWLSRLRQDLVLRNLRQLLNDLAAQMIVGENPQMLGRDHRAEAIHRLLDQRSLA